MTLADNHKINLIQAAIPSNAVRIAYRFSTYPTFDKTTY